MVVCSPSRFQTTRLPELLCSIAENYMASKVKERTEDFSVNLDGKVFRFWTCRVKMELHQGRYTPFEPPNMIGRFLASVFRGIHSGRSASTAKKMIRRIAIEPLESRRLLAVTGSLSGYAYLDTHDFGVKDADEAGFAGLTVQLQSVGSQGNLGNVPGVGLVQTLSDGSYGFTGLAAGTYQVQILPSSKLATGTSTIQVTLAADQNSTGNNFTILGAQMDEISIRMNLASAGSLTQFLTSLHSPPTVKTGNSGSPATYTTGGTKLSITPNATIAVPDSTTLTSMTVTLQNPPDGSSEQLSADIAGTTLTSNYADGELTVSGVANYATYQTVLRSVQYSDSASTASAGNRTISITVNDGTDTSTAVTATIDVVQGANTVPSVTGISPTSGPLAGGTSVTITGTGFSGATAVKFGGAAGTITNNTGTQITATSPADSAGVVDVTVTGLGGTSAVSSADEFTYVAAPAVAGVSPSSGPAIGGTVVTITGTGFAAASTVEFGTIAATNVTYVSATQLTATAPAGAGIVDVTVTTSGETSATSSNDKFSYVPSVTGISPS